MSEHLDSSNAEGFDYIHNIINETRKELKGLKYIKNIKKIQKTNFNKRARKKDDCKICFSDIHKGEYIWTCPNIKCGCKYHSHCIMKSLVNDDRCPLCRQSIDHEEDKGDDEEYGEVEKIKNIDRCLKELDDKIFSIEYCRLCDTFNNSFTSSEKNSPVSQNNQSFTDFMNN